VGRRLANGGRLGLMWLCCAVGLVRRRYYRPVQLVSCFMLHTISVACHRLLVRLREQQAPQPKAKPF
jgi:hypothetical protein